MKGGAQFTPFATLFFPYSKKVPIYCWVDRESFLSSHGKVQPRTHVLRLYNRAALTTRPRRLSHLSYQLTDIGNRLVEQYTELGESGCYKGLCLINVPASPPSDALFLLEKRIYPLWRITHLLVDNLHGKVYSRI